ncbi:hypothetical protein [Bacillus cereus]|uniref:hypothetical protein n=1 Tax=Bacillus cereus TaxID=1396 RepID=UPI000BF34B3A|nr:hypothetical protein [Bacillus cereus]PFQ13499.1 hypothetical protein COK14_09100 [Bacillus cereus]
MAGVRVTKKFRKVRYQGSTYKRVYNRKYQIGDLVEAGEDCCRWETEGYFYECIWHDTGYGWGFLAIIADDFRPAGMHDNLGDFKIWRKTK